MRDTINIVEAVTWNDYGESDYFGPLDPVASDYPSGSQSYALDHTALLPMLAYYSQAFKTGSYPAITQDKIWISARPHTANAGASGDSIGRPDHADWTNDNFYVQVHLTAPASVVLSTNSGSQTFSAPAGISRWSYPMQVGSGVTAKVVSLTVPQAGKLENYKLTLTSRYNSLETARPPFP